MYITRRPTHRKRHALADARTNLSTTSRCIAVCTCKNLLSTHTQISSTANLLCTAVPVKLRHQLLMPTCLCQDPLLPRRPFENSFCQQWHGKQLSEIIDAARYREKRCSTSELIHISRHVLYYTSSLHNMRTCHGAKCTTAGILVGICRYEHIHDARTENK